MNIHYIGKIIKEERLKCGLSQKSLAAASNVSRVTIVNLEGGKVGDIGAVKLSNIAENVGVVMFSNGHKMNFLKMTLGNINTSYIDLMSSDDLEEFMTSGIIKSGFEGQVMHLIDETPTSILTNAVKQLADEKGLNAKAIWTKLSLVAKKIQSPNIFWNSFE